MENAVIINMFSFSRNLLLYENIRRECKLMIYDDKWRGMLICIEMLKNEDYKYMKI